MYFVKTSEEIKYKQGISEKFQFNIFCIDVAFNKYNLVVGYLYCKSIFKFFTFTCFLM